jgi:hypothetical protein
MEHTMQPKTLTMLNLFSKTEVLMTSSLPEEAALSSFALSASVLRGLS